MQNRFVNKESNDLCNEILIKCQANFTKSNEQGKNFISNHLNRHVGKRNFRAKSYVFKSAQPVSREKSCICLFTKMREYKICRFLVMPRRGNRPWRK